MKWPLIPAAVLAVTGAIFVLLSTVSLHAMEYFTAIVPLLAGLYLLFYAFRSHRSGRQHADGPVTDRMNPGTR
jgi:threonine/homoserine/homoserine lactone efflux protein